MRIRSLDRVSLANALSYAEMKINPALYEIVNIQIINGNKPAVIKSDLTEQQAVEAIIAIGKKHTPLSPDENFNATAWRAGYRVEVISHQVTDKKGNIHTAGTEGEIHRWAVESGLYDRFIQYINNL